MDSSSQESVLAVTFRSPTSHRVFAAIKVGFAALAMTLLAAAFFWGAIVHAFLSGSAPVWVHLIGVAVVLCMPVLVLWLAHRSEPTRLVLHEDHLWMGGWLFGREAHFDRVRLVKLERPENTVGKSQLLIVEWRGGPPMRIWLSPGDASESFTALRGLCEHIAAIGLGQEIYGPVDPKHQHHARWVLARDFRRKSRRALYGAVACTLLTFGAVSALTAGASNGRGQPRAIMALVLLPAGAIGSAVAFVKHRRKARELDRENEKYAAEMAAKIEADEAQKSSSLARRAG